MFQKKKKKKDSSRKKNQISQLKTFFGFQYFSSNTKLRS